MKYLSTRGGDERLSFEETVLAGLAPNGGLYIPETIPPLPSNWETEWKDYSFVNLSVAILSLYISPEEISTDTLQALAERSYQTFRHPDVTPLKRLDEKTFVLELFHGPTYAFKDVALQFLGNLFEFFLLRRNAMKGPGERIEKLTVVGATSGDTGSAAIYGLRNKANLSIFILHPKGRVSPIQEAQMTTVMDKNVHNIAVSGTFDDCQDIVKALFSDAPFNAEQRLGAVNSINWARILAQTVYYFWAYFSIRSLLPSNVNPKDIVIQYAVPTGNFGDVLAGYYSKRMGLPMGKLVIATNSNDILTRFWETGRYEKLDSTAASAMIQPVQDGGVKETYSPAMDILMSSNFERLLWYLAYGVAENRGENDPEGKAGIRVSEWMKDVKHDGKMEVSPDVLELARRDFVADRVSDDQTLDTIRQNWPSYILDPHTAVGLTAARRVADISPPSTYQIVLATAHPAKFSEAVSRALQSSLQFNFEQDVMPNEFREMRNRERRVIDVDVPDAELVKSIIRQASKDNGMGSG